MNKKPVHTPEGVRDIYGKEYAVKLSIEEHIHGQLNSYGYEDIQTPTFEFFDVFSKDIGTTPSRELYKFFDKEGNTLVLRPDFTPSMARCAAKYYMDEDVPIRFCYLGNTFTNTSNLQGKLKEVTQMGAELMGDGSEEADGEIIALAVSSLLAAGLQEFQLSIGEIEYFKGICEEVGLDEDTELSLRDYISGKNIFGAEALLLEKGIDEKHREMLLKTTDFFGSAEMLKEAAAIVDNDRSRSAVERLFALYQVLCEYGVEKYISFDLGMLSKYNYYTGVIFKAYAYGVGDAILKGGRYDNLLSRFGKEAPAVGFMVVIDDLMQALFHQNIQLPEKESVRTIIYAKDSFRAALREAKKLRQEGIRVALVPEKNMQERGE